MVPPTAARTADASLCSDRTSCKQADDSSIMTAVTLHKQLTDPLPPPPFLPLPPPTGHPVVPVVPTWVTVVKVHAKARQQHTPCCPLHLVEAAPEVHCAHALTQVLGLARASSARMCPSGSRRRPWLPWLPPPLLSSSLARHARYDAQGSRECRAHSQAEHRQWMADSTLCSVCTTVG
jgi:hypothetical protein